MKVIVEIDKKCTCIKKRDLGLVWVLEYKMRSINETSILHNEELKKEVLTLAEVDISNNDKGISSSNKNLIKEKVVTSDDIKNNKKTY